MHLIVACMHGIFGLLPVCMPSSDMRRILRLLPLCMESSDRFSACCDFSVSFAAATTLSKKRFQNDKRIAQL